MMQEALPALGDWDGPIYGELGVLDTDEGRVCCPALGLWFKALAHHERQTHTTEGHRANASSKRRHQTRLYPHNRAVWQPRQSAGTSCSQALLEDQAHVAGRAKRLAEALSGRGGPRRLRCDVRSVRLVDLDASSKSFRCRHFGYEA